MKSADDCAYRYKNCRYEREKHAYAHQLLPAFACGGHQP
jgi:hypothetical protein